MIQACEEFPNNSGPILKKIIELIPSKPEPYLYLAFEKITHKFSKKDDCILEQEEITESIDLISKAISHLPQLSNNHVSYFFYYRSILHLYSGDYAKSLSDIDKAI